MLDGSCPCFDWSQASVDAIERRLALAQDRGEKVSTRWLSALCGKALKSPAALWKLAASLFAAELAALRRSEALFVMDKGPWWRELMSVSV